MTESRRCRIGFGVTESWLEITDANGSRRAPLSPGLTRIGGGQAEVSLPGVGGDQLHVQTDPLRVRFVGSGAPPFAGGAPFDERAFDLGEEIEWSGVHLRFDGVPPSSALLEEITPAETSSGSSGDSPLTEGERRVWQRMQAGLYADLRLANKKAAKAWQQKVLAGDYDADRCAEDLLESVGPGDELQLLERAGRLQRDFLMAPLASGVRGAGRSVRTATRSGIAFLLAQGLALLVYSLIVALALLFLRIRGASFDGFYDAILGVFGLAPE